MPEPFFARNTQRKKSIFISIRIVKFFSNLKEKFVEILSIFKKICYNRREALLKNNQDLFFCTLESPFSFAKHSSIGVGGTADVAYYPQTEEQLKRLVLHLHATQVPYYTLGNLTNVLPADGEVKKAIIRTKYLRDIYATKDGLYVSAGTSVGAFLHTCKALKIGGAEFLIGIPCTMGGALFMNAGASGEYLAPFIQSVKVLYCDKEEVLPVSACEYSYKKSIFMQEDMIILGATLSLAELPTNEIEQRIGYFLQKRAHLPTGKSMGCVFKNPNGVAAGKLIEGTGLKGLRIGGAKISEKHANFIVNEQNATCADIKNLISVMKNAVFAQYKIRLEEEIRYIT